MRPWLGLALLCVAAWPGPVLAQARTLSDALIRAYQTNPTLAAARAQLRATDEGVPTARAGWRPTIIASGGAGWGTNTLRTTVPGVPGGAIHFGGGAPVLTPQEQLTQPVFNGGATVAAIKLAENRVRAQRAQLVATEQSVFTNALNAYVAVVANRQLRALAIENEQYLNAELTGARVRFKVGEVTLTDVAQAEAALAAATASRLAAEGNLATAIASYRQFIGEEPGALVEPQPLRLPARSIPEARALAEGGNPAVLSAVYAAAAARDQVDAGFAALLPTANVQALNSLSVNQTLPHLTIRDRTAMANLNAPVYQGGAEYAAIRNARQGAQQAERQVIEARRAAFAQLVSAWESYLAARANAESTRAQLRANLVAQEGVRRELIAGSRTTLDLLNAQEAVIGTRRNLVSRAADQVTTSYAVAAAVGRLTVRGLGLSVQAYDETAYLDRVRGAWAGTK